MDTREEFADNMVVAYLDLLGFSELLDKAPEVAADNLCKINRFIGQKWNDNRQHPEKEYQEKYSCENDFLDFVKKTAITSFEHVIGFSDSLILGSHDVDLFVCQLANFVAKLYLDSSEPFKQHFDEVSNVDNNKIGSVLLENGGQRRHKAFPILFRGGLSFGPDVKFFGEGCIKKGKFCCGGYNVFGKTYLKAVELEHKNNKGPGLFCDKSVVENLKDKSLLRLVDEKEEIYEIVWTVKACELLDGSSACCEHLLHATCDEMLSVAINFVNYYSHDSSPLKVLLKYEELLELVCRGIVKYVDMNNGNTKEILELINKTLKDKVLIGYSAKELQKGFMK